MSKRLREREREMGSKRERERGLIVKRRIMYSTVSSRIVFDIICHPNHGKAVAHYHTHINTLKLFKLAIAQFFLGSSFLLASYNIACVWEEL